MPLGGQIHSTPFAVVLLRHPLQQCVGGSLLRVINTEGLLERNSWIGFCLEVLDCNFFVLVPEELGLSTVEFAKGILDHTVLVCVDFT